MDRATATPELDHAWHALSRGAVFTPLASVEALRVHGDDRLDFLQGQLAHDVRGLAVSQVRRALLLDVKGHARAEVTVQRAEGAIDLVAEDGAAPWVRERLQRYVVFDQVAIDPLAGTLTSFTVQGPEAFATLQRAGLPVPSQGRYLEASVAGATVRLARARRSEPGGVDLYLFGDGADALASDLRRAGAVEAPWALLEASRVAAGLPRAVPDAGAGVLPQEAGLDDAFSTRKGCYLGQEIMARLEARGRVKRALVGLRFENAPPSATADGGPAQAAAAPAGDASARLPVLHGERNVGVLGTVAVHPAHGVIALAVLRRDVPDDAALVVGGAPASVALLPLTAQTVS